MKLILLFSLVLSSCSSSATTRKFCKKAP